MLLLLIRNHGHGLAIAHTHMEAWMSLISIWLIFKAVIVKHLDHPINAVWAQLYSNQVLHHAHQATLIKIVFAIMLQMQVPHPINATAPMQLQRLTHKTWQWQDLIAAASILHLTKRTTWIVHAVLEKRTILHKHLLALLEHLQLFKIAHARMCQLLSIKRLHGHWFALA